MRAYVKTYKTCQYSNGCSNIVKRGLKYCKREHSPYGMLPASEGVDWYAREYERQQYEAELNKKRSHAQGGRQSPARSSDCVFFE
jgi:hypothetical protein